MSGSNTQRAIKRYVQEYWDELRANGYFKSGQLAERAKVTFY